MHKLAQDLRFTLRSLGRSPAFTLTAALTVALGVGSNTAMFSVADAVLLRPLPYSEPAGLVMLWSRWTDFPDRTWISVAEYYLYRDQARSFADVAAFSPRAVNLTGADEPERVEGVDVTASLFQVLGVEAALGRTFRPDEGEPGKDGVVVLGDGLWRRRFGADPKVVGRAIELSGTRRTVIGVMPAGFRLPLDFTGGRPSELWLPMEMDRSEAMPYPPNGGSHGYYGLARLAPGAAAASAAAELRTLIAGLAEQGIYDPDRHFETLVVPFEEQVTGAVRPAVLVLLGAVGFVLLIACANVASLLLARRESREREMAVRGALGAGTRDVLRQLLTESLLLAGLGGVAGLWLADTAVDLLVRLQPANLPRVAEVAIDGRVLAFSLGVTLLTGLLFGLLPALQAARPDLQGALKQGARTVAGGRQGLRRALVVVEVAMAVMLVAGAGLMVRTVRHLLAIDPGFESEGVLTLRLTAPQASYPEPQQVVALNDALLGRVRALPGVLSAGATTSLALTSELGDWGFRIEGRETPEGDNPRGDWLAVTPGYFESLGIPLVAGRTFADADHRQAPLAAVINEELARYYWPEGDALGKRIRSGGDVTAWMTVVGIVGDVRHNGLTSEPRRMWYRPYAQLAASAGFLPRSVSLVIRTAGEPRALVGPVREAVRSLDAALPLAEVRTMEEVVSSATAQPRFTMLLLLSFGGLALAMAALGVYGVMAYSVAQRTREIGIRVALGAGRREVLGGVVGQAMALAAAGLAIGLAGALALSGALTSLLYGVSATDPATLAAVAAVVAAMALAASLIPGRRATRVDPIVALRND